MLFPGIDPADPLNPEAVKEEQVSETVVPPPFPRPPRVYKPEGGDLSPWQQAQLDQLYIEMDQTAADTQIKRARANAQIRADDENREAEHRDRDQRRRAELVGHYVATFVLAAMAVVMLSFAAFGSAPTEVRLPFVAAVALLAGLRVLGPSERPSILEWLLRRKE